MSWIISMLIAGLITGSSITPQATAAQAQLFTRTVTVKREKPQTNVKEERFDQTYKLNQNGRVSLSNINGEVLVEAWDRNEVRVEATKKIDCEKPQDIEINVDANQNWVRVETEYDNDNNITVNNGDNDSNTRTRGNRCRQMSVDYKLTVPRAAQLDEIETVNGNISLEGMTNVVKTSTVNGKVSAQNLRGSVNVSTVNGELQVGFASLDNVRDIKVNLVNGQLNLQLPSDANAILKASTVHGNINNDFGLPVRKGEYVGNNLYGKLGDGNIPIRLSSVNGEINVRRNQDGRTLRPATNLLPPKGEDMDDDDDDDDEDVSVHVTPKIKAPKPPKPPKIKVSPNVALPPNAVVIKGDILDEKTREEIRKATRESVKAARIDASAARELAAAQRELIESQREIQIDIAERMEAANSVLTDRKSETVAVENVPNVTIEARGGAVRVRGWDRQEVSYSIVKRNNFSNAAISFQKNGSDVNLRVPADAEDFRLEVYVPKKSNIKVASGQEIRVEGVTGRLDLKGEDESIDVRDSGGKLQIASADGRIRVVGFDGEADVKTADGNIALEGNFKRLSTDTDGGTVVLTLSDNASATIESTTKDVVFDGIVPNGDARESKDSTIWKIGDGSASYKVRTPANGQVFVRNLNSVRIL